MTKKKSDRKCWVCGTKDISAYVPYLLKRPVCEDCFNLEQEMMHAIQNVYVGDGEYGCDRTRGTRKMRALIRRAKRAKRVKEDVG